MQGLIRPLRRWPPAWTPAVRLGFVVENYRRSTGVWRAPGRVARQVQGPVEKAGGIVLLVLVNESDGLVAPY